MASLPVLADDEFSLETRDASPAHILTKIESFSLLSKRGISEVESTEFEEGDYKWKLIIYPDGDDTVEESDHISAHLSMVGATSLPGSWEINAIFNLFIFNHISDNYLCFRGKARRFHAINPKWGISKLMDKKRFTDPSNGYLLNDNCVFGAEVFVIKNNRIIENISVLDITDPYKREWTISDLSKIENVWNSEEFSAGGFKWKIQLYPNGDTWGHGRYISIFLESTDSKILSSINKKVKAICHLVFKNKLHDEKNHSKEVSRWYSSSNPSWGYPDFLAIGYASKGFIFNDSCLLEIQLSVEAIQEPVTVE